MRKDEFLKAVCSLAIPVALQSMLQSSFSMVDQIMIGQLGEVSVAGVGLAGKFTSIYSVIVSAVAAVAGVERDVHPVPVLGGSLVHRQRRRAQQCRRQHQREKER